ncbi:hypothetical protein D3C75_1327250 [compost metagenome]
MFILKGRFDKQPVQFGAVAQPAIGEFAACLGDVDDAVEHAVVDRVQWLQLAVRTVQIGR